MSTETTPAPLRKGDRVRPSGKGKTAAWNSTYVGIVTGSVRRTNPSATRYFVRWDGIAFNDEREEHELELIP